MEESKPAQRRTAGEIAIFVALAFAVTWSIVGAYILWPAQATALMGPIGLGQPSFYAAVYAPSVAAFGLSFWRGGLRGVGKLAAAGVRWRVHWIWIALSILSYPCFWLLWRLGGHLITGESAAAFDFDPWLAALPVIVFGWQILRDPGALGEEFGWRGYMLPRMLQLTNARNAAIGVGVIWALWHLPAFYLSSLSQSKVDFLDFFVSVVGFSVLMTVLFVNTRGSVLWAGIVPHFLINASHRAGIAGEGWIFGAAALVILVVAGKNLRGWNGRAFVPEAAPARVTS